MGKKNKPKNKNQKSKVNDKIKKQEHELKEISSFDIKIALETGSFITDIKTLIENSNCEITFDKFKFNLFKETIQDITIEDKNLFVFNFQIKKEITTEKIQIDVEYETVFNNIKKILKKEAFVNLNNIDKTCDFWDKNFPFIIVMDIRDKNNIPESELNNLNESDSKDFNKINIKKESKIQETNFSDYKEHNNFEERKVEAENSQEENKIQEIEKNLDNFNENNNLNNFNESNESANEIISFQNQNISSLVNNNNIQINQESNSNMDYFKAMFLKLEDEIKTLHDKNFKTDKKLLETEKKLQDEIKLREKTTNDVKGIKQTLAMITYRYMLDLFEDEIHVKDETLSKTQKVRNIFYAIYQQANSMQLVNVWDFGLKDYVEIDCRPFVTEGTLDNLEKMGNLYHTESKLFHLKKVKPDFLKVYIDLNKNQLNNKAKAAISIQEILSKRSIKIVFEDLENITEDVLNNYDMIYD